MEWALFGVVGIITIVAAGAFSGKLGVASPLLLIVIGIGYSYLPGAPTEIPHEWILMGLLPPILYASAITVPVIDFRRNFSSITALSVVLVIVTAVLTGLVLWAIFPDLSLAGGIALGAVISPTDAVAATALGKRLGLPPRLVTILEGEGLVNDATALVLLRSAVAATAAAVTFWEIVGDFAFAVAVAILVGLLIGYLTVFIRSRLRDPILDSAISFAVPFLAFIPAEALGASGVLAVVVAGLYSGHRSAQAFSAQARITERLNWRTLQFVLENGVFLLMGVEISSIIADVRNAELSVTTAVLCGLLLTAVVILIRFAFVAPLLLSLRRQARGAERQQTRFRAMLDVFRGREDLDERARRRQERGEQMFQRRESDLVRLREDGLGWRGGVVLGWSGMRGVVTLAAAQSLPESIPYRSQLVLIAFTVALVTLLAQGGTLPWVIARTGIRGSNSLADNRSLAELLDEMGEAGLGVLDAPELTLLGGEALDPAVVERVRNDTLLTTQSAWERATRADGAAGLADSPHEQYRALRREVLQAERGALLEARQTGIYPSRVLGRAQRMLDLEETRLAQSDGAHGD